MMVQFFYHWAKTGYVIVPMGLETTKNQTIVNGIRRGNFRLHPEGALKLSDGCIIVVNSLDFYRLSLALRKNGALLSMPGGGKAYGTVVVK